MLRARVLPGRPDWWSLYSLIADRPGAVALWTGNTGAPSYLACEPVATARGLDPEPALALNPILGELGSTPRWIGLLPYEATRHLERSRFSPRPDPRPEPHHTEPLWRRYAAVVVHTPRQTWLVGDDPPAVERLLALMTQGLGQGGARSPRSIRVEGLPREAPQLHAERIARAIELIFAGDVYQVNLARRLPFRLSGDSFALLRALSRRAPAAYSLAWRGEVDVVSTSPELFLRLSPNGRLLTRPIKGTAPRGAEASEDEALFRRLDADPKERAELSMVIDVERNDLGRIAETGSVRVLGSARVTRHRTLFHREATVAAQLRSGVARRVLLEAMLPSGSVTGAPKIRAMEVIAELESTRRGLYTGAFGTLNHDGGLELGMAIRTASIRDGEGHFHVGGGIVADSNVAREVEETELKAVQLLSLLGAEAPIRAAGKGARAGRNLAC